MPLLSGKPVGSVGRAGQLVVIPNNCIGCRTCELACSVTHSLAGQMSPSRIRIHPQGEDRYVQLTCLQCADAACAKVCPAGALERNEATGAIEHLPARCVGCGLCAAACPFGHMHFDRELLMPIKCDLCGGRPACAAFCPNQALEVR